MRTDDQLRLAVALLSAIDGSPWFHEHAPDGIRKELARFLELKAPPAFPASTRGRVILVEVLVPTAGQEGFASPPRLRFPSGEIRVLLVGATDAAEPDYVQLGGVSFQRYSMALEILPPAPPATASLEEEGDAFEAWYRTHDGGAYAPGSGNYNNNHGIAWSAWQARALAGGAS